MNKTWDKLPTPRTLSPTEVDTDFLDIFEISDDSVNFIILEAK